MKASLESIIGKYDSVRQGLALGARDFIKSELAGIQEIADESANCIHYCYGPGYKDTICTIMPSRKALKIGFYRGSELADPQNLLTGKGKVHRYVEIKSESSFNLALTNLLNDARKAYEIRKLEKR